LKRAPGDPDHAVVLAYSPISNANLQGLLLRAPMGGRCFRLSYAARPAGSPRSLIS
jgi:hypothetical protein